MEQMQKKHFVKGSYVKKPISPVKMNACTSFDAEHTSFTNLIHVLCTDFVDKNCNKTVTVSVNCDSP